MNIRKMGGIVVILILLVSVAGFAGFRFVFGQGLPAYSTNLTMDGVRDEVKIVRDNFGIPHIYAKNMNDVFFAQGYAQAQDRLWEMDLSRRAVSGHLSEILGESLLKADKFFLTLGLHEAARESYRGYSGEIKSCLESYSAGINQYIREAGNKLPPEFKLLGYKPREWTPLDSVSIGKYMAYTLGGNMTTELLLVNAAGRVGADKLKELFPGYPAGGTTIMKLPWQGASTSNGNNSGSNASRNISGDRGNLPPGILLAAVDARRLDPVLSSILALPGDGVGSNNWVVGGKMTRSGKPILANDMHLEIKNPSIWYQNHLVVEGRMNVTGVIFPGAPGVVSGHNDRVAWGVTNVNPDVQDLYMERRNPQNPYQFEHNGRWEDARVVKYRIPVKGSNPVPFEVVYTRHGPIINSVYPEANAARASEAAKGLDLALKWTAHLPTSELEAVFGFDTARNWAEFKAALEKFKAPAQNFVYADVDGNIAYRANGLIPIRKKGNGLMPVPGWTDEYEWAGFIPWDKLPQTINPPEDFIVTANNKVIDDSYPYFITYQWAPPYRALSIRQELMGKTGLTLDEALRPQTDWKDLQARLLYPSLEGALKNADLDETGQKAREILLQWAAKNPKDDPDEAGPAIFHTLYLEMISATYKDELGDDLFRFFEDHAASVINNNFDQALAKKESLWFDDIRTPGKESADAIIAMSFENTVSRLKKELGGDPAAWKWGKLHTITIDHPMGAKAVLRPIFNDGPYPYGGSGVTSGAATFEYGHPFEVTAAGPWRYGVDLAGMKGKDVLAGGASGQPLSGHYKDQTPLWLKGRYKELLFDGATILKDNKGSSRYF